MLRFIVFAPAAVLLAVLAGCSRPPNVTVSGNSPYGQEGLRVTGTAVVHAKPDYALVTLGCTSSGSRAGATKTANAVAMRRVLDALRAAGVQNKDIQTVSYTMNAESVQAGFGHSVV
jgi:uncharacterized protein YggE